MSCGAPILDLLPLTWQTLATVGTVFLGAMAVVPIWKDRGILKAVCEVRADRSKDKGKVKSVDFRVTLTSVGRRPITIMERPEAHFNNRECPVGIYGKVDALHPVEPGRSIQFSLKVNSFEDYQSFQAICLVDSTGKDWKYPRSGFFRKHKLDLLWKRKELGKNEFVNETTPNENMYGDQTS